MKIGIIGASGKAGSLILKEAVDRGHEVTAIVRNAAKIQDKRVDVVEKNIFDIKSGDLQKYDVVVNAFGAAPGKEHQHVEAGRVLIEALKGAPGTRLVVVGGAGSLFADESKTVRVMDTSQAQNLEDLQHSTGIQWTFVSPAAFFDPAGKRTGSYKKGGDVLTLNSKGESYISYADFAVAILDEIENPHHKNERFSVVGEAE